MKRARHSSPFRSNRGSVLLLCLVFAAGIAVCIGSFIQLSQTASKLSYRTLYAGVAMNAAEVGLERAMWSINRAMTDSAAGWNGWTFDATNSTAKRSFDFGTIVGGATVTVKVFAKEKTATSAPLIVTRAIIQPPQGAAVEKWVQVDLTQRSLFTTGGVGIFGFTFSGNNASVGSWDSDPDNDPNTPPIPWSSTVNNDAGSIAAVEITATINVNNADVYGTAAVGSSSTSNINVGPNGLVGPFGTASGTKDPDSISGDFTADLPVLSAPESTAEVPITYNYVGSVSSDITFPVNLTDPSTTVAGVKTYYYEASDISLTNKVLTVTEGYNVVVHITTTATALKVGGGSGAIKVKSVQDPITGIISTGTLKIYTPGNVAVAGNGIANEISKTIGAVTTTTMQQPASFMLYGTRSTSLSAQSISVAGNGKFSGVIYAPNGDISANGGGSTNGGVYGAMIGRTIKLTGNEGFYYDESLGRMDGDSPYGIDKWTERVSYADRALWADELNF